jgi:hypothetical protein
MFFLPYEKMTLDTALDTAQVVERLKSEVDTSRPSWVQKVSRMFSGDSHKFFQGTIDGSSFKISRIINYRNSFLPVIIGRIEGSKVEITLRTAIFVNIFMMVWLGLTGSTFLCLSKHYTTSSWPSGLMFLFGLLLWLICFRIEAEIAKKKLKALLGIV